MVHTTNGGSLVKCPTTTFSQKLCIGFYSIQKPSICVKNNETYLNYVRYPVLDSSKVGCPADDFVYKHSIVAIIGYACPDKYFLDSKHLFK